ncbi:hypothetical protein B0F90DRAFT_933962 [Multifurca ochricompacta]|uniref:GAR domain-containing protein n=1 Tax=Multifurca ochricompacta TaxID=376703 RepID=A0AAD4M8M7_9AGAM|nr:hypothetical protein B0F90DRAFT_933962 [Multifurca ochricompacta]
MKNVTITAGHVSSQSNGNEKGHDDLQLLAVSTRITELFYSISDIQTRIFEIQELRHKSQSSTNLASATGVIDKALMTLDERLESVARGVKAVNDSLEPLLKSSTTPTPDVSNEEPTESVLLLRKHATFISEWENVQEESEVLREELKEDKWLTVFRTVTDQADGMMSSLEKAINRCQDFIWQFQRHGPDDSISTSSSMTSMGSLRSQKSPLNMEVFQSLLDSYEAKKKHYMPATTKVLSIIDKGVQDRVTKNGECLRRHADSTQRWKHLRERISRTDAEMEAVRRILAGEEEITPSDSGSVASGSVSKSKNRNGYLTPPSASSSKKSFSLSASSALSRSVSPFRKFARKFTGAGKSPIVTTTPVQQSTTGQRAPSSEPTLTLRHRSSLFPLASGQPPTPTTPERLGHKYSHSLTPESSPSSRKPDPDLNITIKGKSTPSRQPWNSSTKIDEDRLRRPSIVGLQRPEGLPPVPTISSGSSPYRRSVSRSSMASSRPWSPIMSSVSTTASTNPTHSQRPPSRSQTPSLNATSPRPRPKTPSYIPAPSLSHLRALSDTQWDDVEPSTSLMQRAFSPDPTTPPRATTPGGTRIPGPRPPSRSMIPAPVFHVLSPSRPGSTLSNYRNNGRDGRESPSQSHTSFRASALRAQTPEATLRSRAQAVPFYGSIDVGSGSSSNNKNKNSPRLVRPSVSAKLPPSSFRETSSTPAPRAPSRPSSRQSDIGTVNTTYLYTPSNPRDPLDAEVATIVNSIAHGLLIERVDPPLKTIPREGQEIRAQYAFSNSLARKTVTCRLTTLSRAGAKGEPSKSTKKVMVRVGGGWQDLQLYMLNRAAGM